MAFKEALRNITVEANADLSGAGKQYRFVKLIGTTGRVNLTDTAGERAFGVLQNKPKGAGHAATVARGGTSKLEAGAAITKGQQVSTDNAGRAIPATTGHNVLGRAVLAVTAAGQIVSVALALEGEPNVA